MANEKTKDTIFIKAIPSITASLSIIMLGFLLFIYVNLNYVQPSKDKEQDEKCAAIEKNIAYLSRQTFQVDSMSRERDGNQSRRQDQLYDILKPMSIKMDIILKNDKKSQKEFDDIKKYLLPGNIAERPILILDTIENFTLNN